jgi:2-aminoadipate transaminase
VKTQSASTLEKAGGPTPAVPEWPFSDRALTLENNILREILKVTDLPGVISFAGGMPAPELFPYDELLQSARTLLESRDGQSLQYSLSRGTHELRRWIAQYCSGDTPIGEDDVLVTSGAQQGLDVIGRAFLRTGDRVLTARPTYVGLIHAFNFYGADMVTCGTDDLGLDPDAVDKELKRKPAKLIYVVATFDNPTGRTMSLERRKRLLEVAEHHGVPVIDDNPYDEVYYRGQVPPSLRLLNPEWAMELKTFSKMVSPGLRIGWLMAPRPYMQIFERVKQSTDLHANTFCQRLIHLFCTSGRLEPHLQKLRSAYRARLECMLAALDEHMPEGIRWTRPDGGLFLWVTLPDHLDAEPLLKQAVQEKVAFVPGRPFYPKADSGSAFRLNFSNQPEERIREGISRLGRILKKQRLSA